MPRIVIRLFAAASLLVLAAGCGGSGGGPLPAAMPDPPGYYRDLKFTLTTDKSAYNPGETVQATLTVTNIGAAPVPYGVLVESCCALVGQDGYMIWNADHHFGVAPGGAFPFTLNPGQTLAVNGTQWNETYDNGSPAGPGQYTLVLFTEYQFYSTLHQSYGWFAANFGATATVTIR